MQAANFPVEAGAAAYSDPFPSSAPVRLLVFADLFGASQAIAFIEGLAASRGAGEAAVRILDEERLGPDFGSGAGPSLKPQIEAHLAETSPTAIVLSRFGHAAAYEAIREAADEAGLPVFFHIDDDLYDLPATMGIERYRGARHPRRVRTLQRGLQEADFVMAATEVLAERLVRIAGHGRIGWLENGTAGRALPRRPKRADAPLVIGYMGSASHGPDLELAIPALNAIVERFPKVRLELFGSIARQPAADLLPSSTIRRDPAPGGYAAFKSRLMTLQWDIGLAPLLPTPYNSCKTATKWVEYAEAGIAVAASEGEVYQPMIAEGAAVPARGGHWEAPLRRLIGSAELRLQMVRAADRLLGARYGWDRLETSILHLLARGRALAAAA